MEWDRLRDKVQSAVVQFRDGHNVLGWAGLKQVASPLSPTWWQAQTLGTSSTAFLRPLAGSWNGTRAEGTKTGTHMKYLLCRRWLYLLYHNMASADHIYISILILLKGEIKKEILFKIA